MWGDLIKITLVFLMTLVMPEAIPISEPTVAEMETVEQSAIIAPSSSNEVELVSRQEIDYTKQCVYCARELSPYQPIKSGEAKDIPITMLEPRLGFWAVYDAGCQYGESGHIGVVSYNINLDEEWFVERGCNLDGKGGDYTRRVYYKKDHCFKGLYGKQD